MFYTAYSEKNTTTLTKGTAMQIKTIAKFVTVISTSVASQSVVSAALENIVGSVTLRNSETNEAVVITASPNRYQAAVAKLGIHSVSAAVGGTIGSYVAKEFDEYWDTMADAISELKAELQSDKN